MRSISCENSCVSDFSQYLSAFQQNVEIFRRNCAGDYNDFESIIENIHDCWARAGVERDQQGRSSAGLLPFANLLIRHAIFGFQHLASYQSFLAWSVFRPGLEAFLITGKFVDDPANATVWKNRNQDWKAYEKAFSRKNIISRSLPRSGEFQQVLKMLNDDFMHPNPEFTWRHMAARPATVRERVVLELHYFDRVKGQIHEANVLAYVNLLNVIRQSSVLLTNQIFGERPEAATVSYADKNMARAAAMILREPMTETILKLFGLWTVTGPQHGHGGLSR